MKEELTFLEKRKLGIEKVFKDLKVGDEIYFQHLHQIAEYYGWSCSLVHNATITSIETSGNDITVHTDNNTFHLKDFVNIDVYYADEENKYYVGTNANNLMKFLNVNCRFDERDVLAKMVDNLSMDIDTRIIERLKSRGYERG